MEKYKKEFPCFFERTVYIKLNRIKLEASVEKRSKKSQQNGSCDSMKRVTRSAKNDVSVPQWIRILDGLYKGDLGQVTSFDQNNQEVHVEIFPRIDYASISNNPMPTAEKTTKKRRPFPRLFDAQAIRYEFEFEAKVLVLLFKITSFCNK